MSRRAIVTSKELYDLAEEVDLEIQHDCGGYRVVQNNNRYVFPNGLVCPTATKRECMIFLRGMEYSKERT